MSLLSQRHRRWLCFLSGTNICLSDEELMSALLFITIHVLSVEMLSVCVFVRGFVGAPNLQGCFVKTALKGNYHHHLWRKSSHHPLFLTPPRVIANVLAHLQPKIYSFPFHGRLSPPPYWCVSQRTQGWCLTEPWMLFSCHTFPKRLAAAPIVATEGGLLSWSFRPPAVALVSDGSTVRERGPNNGQRLDVMLLMRARSLKKYMVGFHCMEQIDREISDLPVGLELRGTLQMFFFSLEAFIETAFSPQFWSGKKGDCQLSKEKITH